MAKIINPLFLKIPNTKAEIENKLKTIVYFDFTKSLNDICGNEVNNRGNVISDTSGATFGTGKQLLTRAFIDMERSDYTFEMIFNIANNNDCQNFFVVGGNGGIQILYNQNLKAICATRYGGASLNVNGLTFTKWGQDVHLAVVKSGREYSLYIDGVLENKGTGDTTSQLGLYISGYVNTSYSYPINGKVKMVKVTQKALRVIDFQRDLTGNFIKKLNSITYPLKTKIFFDFTKSLEEQTGNKFTSDGISRNSDGALFTNGKQAVVHTQLNYDDDLTVEMIVKVTKNVFQCLGIFGGQNGLQIDWNNETNSFRIGQYGGGLNITPRSNLGLLNQYVHVAVVKKGNVYKSFINGELHTTSTGTLNPTDKIYLGGYIGTNSKQYTMQDTYIKMIRVTQVALEQEEFTKEVNYD